MKEAVFQETFLCTDVLCVKFIGDYILAGVGGSLKIFRIGCNECIKVVEVFSDHRIHRIQSIENEKLILSGAKQVVVATFQLDSNEVAIKKDASLEVEDWVLHTHWLPSEKSVAIITAHNVVWFWSWERFPNDLRCIKCTEKCILYSAYMCGHVREDSVIFCGTVFREVILWIPSENSSCSQPVLHRLKGHHGVIFSITWDEKNSLICSTSDDRSVRTWKVDFSLKNSWKESTISPLQVYYGHTARVWKSLILHNSVVSCGEDSQICVWNLSGTLLQKWDRSNSGCIWSLDYSEKHKILVVGGGDGSIQVFPLTIPVVTQTPTAIFHPNHLIAQSDYIRKLCITQSGNIIAVTVAGILLTRSYGPQNTWKIICQDPRFANYCILSVSCGRTFFSLASLNGHVVVYQESNMVSCLDEKIEGLNILAFFWLSNNEFLTCSDEGLLTVWEIDNCIEPKLKCKATFILPPSRERWPTAAITTKFDTKRFLLCGDRCGSLHLFKFIEEKDSAPGLPHQSLFKIHGHLGVTSITESKQKILSTGRDGILRFFRISKSELFLISDERMVTSWVAKVVASHNHSNLYVIGFKEKNIVLWDSTERFIMMNIECGGGHRSWDCLLNEEKIEIAFIRDKQVYAGSWHIKDIMQPSLQQGMLANEINSVHLISSSPRVLAFGGEDGTILVAQFLRKFSVMQNTTASNSHISSIRCLSSYGTLLFSAGGRAQLKAWRLENDDCGGSLLLTELASFMLKGDRPKYPRPAAGVPHVDPEMRFMNLCCVSSESENLLLVSGCSDGTLRFLNFNTSRKLFTLVGESMFHGRCILSVSSISMPNGRSVVLSGATDGIIALWNISGNLTTELPRNPFWSRSFHQSGINSIHVKVLENVVESVALIASGGDDNALCLSAVQIEDSHVIIKALWKSHIAHAAQITGVWIVNNWLISCSIDQRLTLWQWNIESSEPYNLACKFIHQCVCQVPDIQDMQVWEESHCLFICVAGKGIEILQFSTA